MKSNEYRLKMIARMIRESNSLSSDPDDYFSDLKDEFLEEAVKMSDLNSSYQECFFRLVKMKIFRYLKEISPEIVYRVPCVFNDFVHRVTHFTVKDFSGVIKKISIDHLKEFLLKDLNEFLIRKGNRLTYTYSIDLELSNDRNDLEVTIETDTKKNQ